jgi:hypothetical protein
MNKDTDLDLNLPAGITDWPPRTVPVEVWLAEQQRIVAEFIKTPEYAERCRRKFENYVPFVWKD